MSRRQFIRESLAAASLALVRDGAAAEPQPTTTRADGQGPGIGVIGLRYQGSVIAAQARPHGRIVCMADVDRSCLDLTLIDTKVTGQTGMKPAEIFANVAAADRHVDYRRLLDDKRVDVVLIGAPDHWHSKMLIDAVQAGKDVYCEKPLTLTIDEGKDVRSRDHPSA